MLKRFVILFFLIALSGCVNQQKEIDTYRKVLDEKAGWWIETEPSHPLSLEESLLLANQNNEQLAIKGEEYLQALIDKDRAFSAFLPTIGLSPSLSLQDGYQTMPILGVPNQPHTWDVPVTGQLNVFNGFRDVSNFRRAGANIDRQKALLKNLQDSLLLEVAQTYYQVLRDEKIVDPEKYSSRSGKTRCGYSGTPEGRSGQIAGCLTNPGAGLRFSRFVTPGSDGCL
jgi:outer membrane protein TolC